MEVDLTTAQVIGAVICVIGLMAGSYLMGLSDGEKRGAAKRYLLDIRPMKYGPVSQSIDTFKPARFDIPSKQEPKYRKECEDGKE